MEKEYIRHCMSQILLLKAFRSECYISLKTKKLFRFAHVERLERSPEDEEYTLNFEESVMSSHTATDDEIDFRMILPSESHRRRSLGTTGRSSSLGSDQGTVSYSSVSCDTDCENFCYRSWFLNALCYSFLSFVCSATKKKGEGGGKLRCCVGMEVIQLSW